MTSRWMLWIAAALVSLAGACSSPTDDAENAASSDDAVDACSARNEVILWSSDAYLLTVAKHLAPNAACTDYYVGVPLDASDKTNFHPAVAREIAAVHALGANFHAVAEFQWGAWRDWIAASPGTRSWHAAGLELRARMKDAGFAMFSGNSDTWLINEFPSTILRSKDGVDKMVVRANALEAVRGLYEGGGVKKKGAIARSGTSSTPGGGMAQYKGWLEELITDGAFWKGMNDHVRWWGEEVYADPHDVCVGTATLADRARHMNDYVFHMVRLADAGPAAAGPARDFFAHAYVPFLNGAWMTNGGYGDVRISEANMSAFLSEQVYATHAFADGRISGKRLAWAWTPSSASSTPAELDSLGTRLADAMNGAFAKGSRFACSPSGAFTDCHCAVSGAKLDEVWHDDFGTW